MIVDSRSASAPVPAADTAVAFAQPSSARRECWQAAPAAPADPADSADSADPAGSAVLQG